MTETAILLVDDNVTSLKLLHAIFDGEGYRIHTANDGLEALEVLLQERIDLVITDVLMPNMDGYHLCYRIRTNPKLTDIPVVIYTATYVSLSEAKIAMEMGASYYLRKPATSQTLISVASDILKNPKAFPHKIPTKLGSTGVMRQYSAKLIAKLEQSNVDLEQAKNRIEQREKYFKALVENDYSITVLTNEKFETIYRSPSSVAILGWTIEEQSKMNPDTIVHPDDRVHQQSLMRKVLESPGSLFPVATRLRHKSGSYLWLEGVCVNRLADPDVCAIVTNLHDVTERKNAETELESSRQHFQALIENSSDAIVLNDEHFMLQYQSPSVARILGYTIHERKGTKPISYVHPEDRSKAEALYQDSIENPNRPIHFQYRFKHREGHYVWLEGTLTNLLGNPHVKAFVANYRDITQRKKTEEELAIALRRFEQAQQIAHLGNWELDLTTLKITWSAEMFRIYGIEPYSVEPSDELFMSLIHPDDLERVKAVSPRGIHDLSPFSLYHRIIHSGNTRHLFTVGRYEFDAQRKPVTLFGISLDITELAEKEEKLTKANKELATFIYKAYHDLRSPIVSVLGLINVASSEIKDKQSLEYFSMIRRVAESQRKMLLNLINVMSFRDRKLVITEINLDELVDDVHDALKPVGGVEDVEFKASGHGTISTDRELMFTIIYNIAENAIIYRDTKRKGRRVQIIASEGDSGNASVEIIDNGVGISNDVKARIFDLFFRGSELSKGAGLGLYLAKNAAEQLGAAIEVSSKIGKGTTFRLTFPGIS